MDSLIHFRTSCLSPIGSGLLFEVEGNVILVYRQIEDQKWPWECAFGLYLQRQINVLEIKEENELFQEIFICHRSTTFSSDS